MPAAPPRQHHGDPAALPPRSPPHPRTTPGPPPAVTVQRGAGQGGDLLDGQRAPRLGQHLDSVFNIDLWGQARCHGPVCATRQHPGGGRAPSPRVHPTTSCVCVCVSRVSAHTCCACLHSYTHTAQRLSVHELARVPAHITTYVHKHTPCTLVPAHTPRHSLQPGPPRTHRTLVCSPCTLLVHKHCTHTLCTHKCALTVHACSYTRVHAKWCSRWCPPAHTHTHTLLCKAACARLPSARRAGAPCCGSPLPIGEPTAVGKRCGIWRRATN